MPLNEERKMILKMLQEGKITSEEAERLLDALDGGQRQNAEDTASRQRKQTNFQDEFSKVKDRVNEWTRDFKTNYGNKDFDRAVEDFAAKAEKVGKNVATTTFGLVDKMVDFVGSFIDTNAFNIFGSYKTIEKTYEALATDGMKLEIEGLNGFILVKKHQDSRIIIKSKIKSPQDNIDEIVSFVDDGTDVALKVNKISNMSVSHEVFLPDVRFASVRLLTTNGKIYVEDTRSGDFEVVTKNSHIELMGVNSDKVAVSTKNAKIQINYVIGRVIDVNTSNSLVDIKHVKAQELRALTTNGRIFVENVQNMEGSHDINMNLKTSNGGIKVNMNDMDNKGYRVKGQTTNGSVNILIPEMIYHNASKGTVGTNLVEAESNGYVNYTDKVFISASTVNGYIEVVK